MRSTRAIFKHKIMSYNKTGTYFSLCVKLMHDEGVNHTKFSKNK